MCEEYVYDNPLVLIVGMCGAGKSIVANYLQRKGWQVIRFGEITINELASQGLQTNEANERRIREEVRRLYGPDAYAKRLFPRIKEALSLAPTAIDGLYSWAEYKFIKKNIHSKVYVLLVFTPRSIRYEHLRHRSARPLEPDEAEERDIAEIEYLQKGGPIALADYVIMNCGSEQDLLSQLNKLIETEIIQKQK